MEKHFKFLLTTASWEERFHLGYIKNLSMYSVDESIVLNNIVNPHVEETQRSLNLTIDSTSNKCKPQVVNVNFADTLDIWRSLEGLVKSIEIENQNILVDITTTPREIIWYVLHFLIEAKAHIYYIYHKPESYTSDWLTKDPRKPRFILKHSGISEFSRATALLILTGFDHSRTEQLINFYEPKFIILGVQENNGLDAGSRNALLHERLIKRFSSNIEVVTINSYKEEDCLNQILNVLEKYTSSYNFIMSSLGPKISAITLYKIFLKHSEIAIAYARSHEYNLNYSAGIGEFVYGKFTVPIDVRS